MSTVQNEYLTKTKTVVTTILPEPPSGDAWHNPERIPAERVPEGMRLLTEKELESKAKRGEIYLFLHGSGDLIGGCCGTTEHITYFTNHSYPLWERAQFVGDTLNSKKFYGGIHEQSGDKVLLVDAGFETQKYRVLVPNDKFTIGNSYFHTSGALLKEIRDYVRIYEFDSLTELASWIEAQ